MMGFVLRQVHAAILALSLLSFSSSCIDASTSKVQVLDNFLGSDEIEALFAQVASDSILQRQQRDLIEQVRLRFVLASNVTRCDSAVQHLIKMIRV